MSLSIADTLVLLGYLAIILCMGVSFSKRNQTTEDYFVGGRRFKGWVIGLSLVGTSISSITFLAYPADAFKTGWLRYLPNLMLPIAALIAAYLFLPFFRRRNMISAYEYLEERYGSSVRVYGAIAFTIAQLSRLAMILWLLSLLVQEVTGLSPTAAIVIGGLFVGTYTIVGGIEAVIWTDVLQTIVLLVGGIACLWVIVDLIPGGLNQIIDTASAGSKFTLAEFEQGQASEQRWDLSLTTKTGTMMFFVGLTAWLTEYSSNQNTVQRYCASASTTEARRGMLVCVLASLPIWAFYMFLGTALWVFYQVNPDPSATAMLAGTEKAEHILPLFITTELPNGLAGLVIAAALAAAMSSLDSSINSVSAVGIVDIYKRHLKPNETDAHYLMAAKGLAVVIMLIMIAGALWLETAETRTLQDTSTILVSLLGGGLLGLYLLGFLTKGGDARAAWTGIGFTMLFTGWTILAKKGLLPDAISIPFDLYYTGIIGNLLMFVVGYTASKLFTPAAESKLQ